MKRIASFDGGVFQEHFPEQALAAQQLMQRCTGDTPEYRCQAELIADDILRNDVLYVLSKGHKLRLDESAKAEIAKRVDELVSRDILYSSNVKGKCLVCGKNLQKGDISLCETDGSGNVICLDCCTSQNTVSSKCGTVLFVCK